MESVKNNTGKEEVIRWESIKSFVHRSPIETIVTDINGHFIFANPSFLQFIDSTKADLEKTTIYDFFQEESKSKIRFLLKRVTTGGNSVPSFKEVVSAQGQAKPVKISIGKELIEGLPRPMKDTGTLFQDQVFPIVTQENFEMGIIWRFQNIQELEALKQEISYSKKLIHAINENLHDAVYVRNEAGELIYANKLFKTYFATHPTAYLSDEDIFAHKSKNKLIFSKLSNGNEIKNEKILFQNKSGEVFWGLLSGFLSYDEKGDRLYTISISDIHEQVSTKLKYNQILEQANSAIILADENGQIDYFNHAAERMFGISREKILQRELSSIMPEEVLQRLKKILKLGSGPESEMNKGVFEVELHKVNGRRFWGSISLNAFKLGSEGQYIIFITDATERITYSELLKDKNEELKKTNRQLDSFLYSAYHDLRSPLTTLLGLSNLMKMNSENQELSTYGKMISETVTKLDRVLLDMITFSKNAKQNISTDEVNLEELIEEVMANLSKSFDLSPFQITWERNIQAVLYSDAERLKVIFFHILKNAIQFSDLRKEEKKIGINIHLNYKGLEVIFSDNGIGISPTHLAQIFEMFYRGSELSKGSGLGLYLVQETIDKLGGSIEAKSEKGENTIFKVYIPNGLKARLMSKKAELKNVN
jgi:PAS domain S-box-containing protein